MTVAVIDYGSGNLRSVAKAFERAAADRGLGESIIVTADADMVRKADRVVLPGVGAFADCRAGIAALPGMIEALEETVHRRGRPFFGICVGMQLMAERGLEHGTHRGFGWIQGDIVRLAPADASLKIPHMGWNDLAFARRHPLFEGIAEGTPVYFVHSYHLAGGAAVDAVATADYGGPVLAAVGRDNLVGTQFHPEKSQAVGLKIVGNFLAWRP
ncbi:MAG: imidazole glycerol phosphate synthase subunit HisH [Alphaproteobacteria bacterium]|nr:imidazole glycerol phosphate synthase subunit HisH [Alphaproteobacteria bacterium]